ncbi:TetR/AcrR family transcriptional regulator [Chitinophaga agrisoli]|uniref:TetR/AcrR family transcriptional regulator n=1 Tax=Chitinophaga agrisoli TaxID=2607653 RepID=A0A5B2W4F0_9BACT|nr:TetR/AcrR family transcriptional regulator [Chitinophaga agrisoli]KAA2245426.1 TetR/AcrR family transcriptional regulator [Chitinophaga agrisoli]
MRVRDENKEKAIREKAIAMIVREGLDGFGVNKLAKAAGVSPATIYIYYKDRDDLILQIGQEIATDLMAHSLANFDPDAHFAEGLKRQWINRAAYFMQHPVEVAFIEQIRYSHYNEKIHALMKERFSEIMGRFVNNAIERKELVQLPFEVFWSVAYAPLYQLIKFHTQGQSYVNKHFEISHEVMMQTLQLVLKALKP